MNKLALLLPLLALAAGCVSQVERLDDIADFKVTVDEETREVSITGFIASSSLGVARVVVAAGGLIGIGIPGAVGRVVEQVLQVLSVIVVVLVEQVVRGPGVRVVGAALVAGIVAILF